MNDLMNLVDWSRAQFALTAIYHWIFVPLTLGLGVIVAVMETLYLRRGRDPKWLATTKFWQLLFGINFAIGVATGIILEFEFGTNWSNYSWFVGDIFGAPLAIEGILAFFMESTFIAVMFFGWNKVSPRFHLAATWLTAIGASLSALWILVANAWMQYPTGMEFNPDTMRNEMVSFANVALSPMALAKFGHTVLSAWALAGCFVVGVSCWMLLKGRNRDHALRSIKVGAWVGTIGIVMTMITGDCSAITVSKHQPMKLAAMEGLYQGDQGGQAIVAVGVLNPAKTIDNQEPPYLFHISVPYGLSFLATGNHEAFVPGIKDIIEGRSYTPDGKPVNTVSYAERIERGKAAQQALAEYDKAKRSGDQQKIADVKKRLSDNFQYFGYGYFNKPSDAVPNVALSFYSFHFMVIAGCYMLLILAVALVLSYKQKWLARGKTERIFGILALIGIPVAYLCSMSGWIVAEVGRQPWVIQDLMPCHVAVSDLSSSYVQATFWVFAVLFTVLLIAEVNIMCRQISKKSKGDLNVPQH